MDKNQYAQLTKIYNTLVTVMTSGEDTIIMAQCLLALKNFIENIQLQD